MLYTTEYLSLPPILPGFLCTRNIVAVNFNKGHWRSASIRRATTAAPSSIHPSCTNSVRRTASEKLKKKKEEMKKRKKKEKRMNVRVWKATVLAFILWVGVDNHRHPLECTLTIHRIPNRLRWGVLGWALNYLVCVEINYRMSTFCRIQRCR